MSQNTPSPAEQLAEEITTLQHDFSSLSGDISFASIQDELEDLESKAANLAPRVHALRAQSYAFERDLAQKAMVLHQRWKGLRPSVQNQLKQQAAGLQKKSAGIQAQMGRLNALGRTAAARPVVTDLRAKVEILEDDTRTVERTLRGMYNTNKADIEKLGKHLETIEWMIKQLQEACFQLLAGEAGIMAVKAVWLRDDREDKDDPEGVLFLTDRRLIFEQKEQVATQKILFFTKESKQVQECLVKAPLNAVSNVDASKRGFFKNEDHLQVDFSGEAQYSCVRFHLFGQEGSDWQAMIGRARAGDYERDRAIAVSQAEKDKLTNVPTNCPGCGAPLGDLVVRGMEQITCKYCGNVIRF